MGYAETLPSCRPEGLRLYDLLAGLSLKPFGVLAWSVLDKEEELFEMTDTRDEDKVMQVLWGRWIMLNRRCVLEFEFTQLQLIARRAVAKHLFLTIFWVFKHLSTSMQS